MSDIEVAAADLKLLDQVAERVRTDQVQGIAQAGLPADLVATERSALRRFSPRRNRWVAVAEFDARVLELEQRQLAATATSQQLHEQEATAPAQDAARLAAWELDGREGPRPDPELPRIRERIAAVRAEWDGLVQAIAQVLDEKAEYVERHRKRLVRDADKATFEARARYLEAIDAVAAAREELADLRASALWAALYVPRPAAAAGAAGRAVRQPAPAVAAGRVRRPGRPRPRVRCAQSGRRLARACRHPRPAGQARGPRPANRWRPLGRNRGRPAG